MAASTVTIWLIYNQGSVGADSSKRIKLYFVD